MINRIMKNNAMKSLQKDLDRLDRTRSYADVSVIADKSYIPDDTKEHTLDVYYVAEALLSREEMMRSDYIPFCRRPCESGCRVLAV